MTCHPRAHSCLTEMVTFVGWDARVQLRATSSNKDDCKGVSRTRSWWRDGSNVTTTAWCSWRQEVATFSTLSRRWVGAPEWSTELQSKDSRGPQGRCHVYGVDIVPDFSAKQLVRLEMWSRRTWLNIKDVVLHAQSSSLVISWECKIMRFELVRN